MPISKRLYLQSLQCPRLLWHSVHQPSIFPSIDPSSAHRMQAGRNVEECARQLFPEGVLIGHERGLEESIRLTNAAIKDAQPKVPIFQSVLKAGHLLCEIDILLPVKGGRFDLYEVKSSTGLKDEYLPDIAFQTHVAKVAGLNIRKCHLIAINSGYVRHGEIQPKELFTVQDVTEEIAPHLTDAPANIAKARKIIASKTCPDIPIGAHCADCPLKELPNLCWQKVHAEPQNIFDLYRLPSTRAFGWFHDGFLKSAELPDDYPLSDKQGIQIKAEKSKKPYLNQKTIGDFCKRLQFPLFFLDFETFASPIPMLDQSRPYEAIPFQFSLHIIRKSLDEKPQHISWIWEGDVQEDPREEMLHCLMHLLERKGSIVAYNAAFEKGVMKQAVALYPDYADAFKAIMGRFVDLLEPFRGFSLYHPAQHGSCSMKDVLPAWCGKGYDGLAIQDGQQASREFMWATFEQADPTERERVMANLEAYCGLDTEGMLLLARKLAGMTAR